MPVTPTFAMHAPDGFLEPGTAIVTGLIAAAVLAVALRVASDELGERQAPLAGVVAAFVFAAQMFNFPVASGTTGHLIGGALAAILLGPWLGTLVVAVVVIVQALLFADGGISALGYNLVNMAVVPAFGGWAVYRLVRRMLPATSAGVVGATAVAALASVVLAAVAFSLEWLFGASAPVPFDTVFAAMVGVHVLIGIGEAIISAMVVAAVLASRPDLVAGARDLDPAAPADGARVGMRPFVIGGLVVTLGFAAVVSQFAVDDPDGLERVAEDEGFIDSATDHTFGDSIFADYATNGIDNEQVSLAVAGIAGVVLSLAVMAGITSATRQIARRPT